jgi:hypothetical protein
MFGEISEIELTWLVLFRFVFKACLYKTKQKMEIHGGDGRDPSRASMRANVFKVNLMLKLFGHLHKKNIYTSL